MESKMFCKGKLTSIMHVSLGLNTDLKYNSVFGRIHNDQKLELFALDLLLLKIILAFVSSACR